MTEEMDIEINKFCGTEGVDYLSEECGLSNLFKHAVPELNEWGYIVMLETVPEEGLTDVCILSPRKSGGIWNGNSEDPAEAFGQALLKLIKDKE